MKQKKSFVMYHDLIEAALDGITDDAFLSFWLAITNYQLGRGNADDLKASVCPEARPLFLMAIKRFNQDEEKYRETCESRAMSGALGGRPQKKAKETKRNQKKPKKANALFAKQNGKNRCPRTGNTQSAAGLSMGNTQWCDSLISRAVATYPLTMHPTTTFFSFIKNKEKSLYIKMPAKKEKKKVCAQPSELNCHETATASPGINENVLGGVIISPVTKERLAASLGKDVLTMPSLEATVKRLSELGHDKTLGANFGDFCVFWKAFNHSKSLKDSVVSYNKARKKVSADVILDGVVCYHENRPADIALSYPSTWLNKERWNDEPTPVDPEVAKAEQKKRDYEAIKKKEEDERLKCWNAPPSKKGIPEHLRGGPKAWYNRKSTDEAGFKKLYDGESITKLLPKLSAAPSENHATVHKEPNP